MDILVNEKKQGQCPSCGAWNELTLDKNGLIHEFSCCRRNFMVAIDEENLNKLAKGKKVKKPDVDWYINNR